MNKYYYKETKIDKGKGYWNYLLIEIFTSEDNKKIGEYTRNYSSMFNTFVPFTKDGKDYALYSPDYTSTRIMSLPDCRDLGGEERNTYGFCPVDYYIPFEKIDELEMQDEIPKNFGFVAGCIWGDDSSWKIRYIDLSDIKNGNIKIDDRFGYIQLPYNLELKNAIDIEDYPWIRISHMDTFNIEKKI